MKDVKVLAFDTGGTVLDWHAGLTTAMATWAPRKVSSATGTRWRTSIAAARCAG
jgi:hypothetical protein